MQERSQHSRMDKVILMSVAITVWQQLEPEIVLSGVGRSASGAEVGYVSVGTPLVFFIHGLAGDAAAERVGHCAMMASDIVDGLMDVLRKQEDTKRQ